MGLGGRPDHWSELWSTGGVEPMVSGGYLVMPTRNERDPAERLRRNEKMAFDRRDGNQNDRRRREARTTRPSRVGEQSVELPTEACHRSRLLRRGSECGSEDQMPARLLVGQSKPKL